MGWRWLLAFKQPALPALPHHLPYSPASSPCHLARPCLPIALPCPSLHRHCPVASFARPRLTSGQQVKSTSPRLPPSSARLASSSLPALPFICLPPTARQVRLAFTGPTRHRRRPCPSPSTTPLPCLIVVGPSSSPGLARHHRRHRQLLKQSEQPCHRPAHRLAPCPSARPGYRP